jgi:FkbM family methyltransferase
MLKNVMQNLAETLGYTILPTWRVAGLPLANCLREIFVSRNISTVIDVGANKGQYRNFLRNQVGFRGRIVSFEPLPELAANLKTRAAADGNWTVHARALGAATGELSLNVMAASVFSSFLQPREGASFAAQNAVMRTEIVPVSTLDAEFPDSEVLRTTFLKLDTQGFDLEVLRGAPVSAGIIPALQSEVSFEPIYENMPAYHEAMAEFGRHGFAVADMFLVNQNECGIAVEFDCVMVRGAVADGINPGSADSRR